LLSDYYGLIVSLGKVRPVSVEFAREVALAAALALGVGLLLMPLMVRLCLALGWVDRPDHRKLHEGPIPLAGGLLICAAVLIASLIVAPGLAHVTQFWLSAAMVLAIGFADDRFPIRARYRFAVQVSAALVFVALSGAIPTDLGRLLGPFVLTLGIFALPFAAIGITGLTNALNMMDGLDGLAGGLALTALCWLLVAFALIAGDVSASAELTGIARQSILLIALVAGALIAFLFFNQRAPWRVRASMFLGDGGSMTLGFLLAALSLIACSAFGPQGMTPVTAAWIAAVPLTDMFASMLRRVLVGKTPMTPDRMHVHHLLLALGLETGGTVVVLHGLSALTGLIGVAGWRLGVPEYWMFWGLLGAFAAYFVVSQRIWSRLTTGSDGPPPSTHLTSSN